MGKRGRRGKPGKKDPFRLCLINSNILMTLNTPRVSVFFLFERVFNPFMFLGPVGPPGPPGDIGLPGLRVSKIETFTMYIFLNNN